MNEPNVPDEKDFMEEIPVSEEPTTVEVPEAEVVSDEVFSQENIEVLEETTPEDLIFDGENLGDEPASADDFPMEEIDLLIESKTDEVLAESESVYPASPSGGVYPPEEIYYQEDILHEDLESPEIRDELMAADHAMYTAGLQHPEDAEFLFDDDPSVPEVESAILPEQKEEEQAPPVKKERPIRKGRPKRKKGPGLFGIPHILATLIWLLIVLAIGVTLGRMLWVCAADVLAFGREDQDVTISVTTDDTMESIAQKLQSAGLVRYPELFLLYADLTDAEEDITTGTFTLNTVYDYHALVSQMSPRSGNRVVIEDVLIPEGYNCRQIFALLEEKGICKAADLEKWAAEGELSDFWFLDGVERGDKYCLEGFLFPDTYDFYENSTPRAALEKMLKGFEYRVNEELRVKIPILNEHLSDMMRKNGDSEEFIAANQFDIRDVINIASLIEKETASNQESYTIASVIYNRLFNWGSNPRYLNIDATIIYALGGKTNLTAEDMAVDSPYNTYTNVGMTPGPIANPGLASIEAALDPETTSYYYYVLNPDTGVHQFSKTLAEHEKYVSKFYGD